MFLGGGADPMNLGYSATLPPVAAERTPDYAVLFQREFPKVVCTVYLVVRDHGRAEELAQEAFVQLLMHWKKVSGYDRPEAWVRRVAIRLAMRSSTRERLRSVLERRAVVEPPPGEGVDLSEALGQLSAPQRAAIVLHYYEDRPVDEVADILVCSVNTVKSHLHRGRNKLRVLLGECEGDLDES
jgi:RNA polymerase sigma-70 factor (ECF subfamily)